MKEFITTSGGTTSIGGTPFEWGQRTYIMGVINLTPDSFSGDGLNTDVESALNQALQFEKMGADIIDVGGESTRPSSIYSGVEATSLKDELSRVIPVIEVLTSELGIPISVDTYKSLVAKEALGAGASMINDVWGFTRDPDISRIVAAASVPVVLMHNQDHTNYDDLVPDVISGLTGLRDYAIQVGIAPENIILDPGMGFGKTAEQNLEILRRLDEFMGLNCPILVGMSRKSTIGYVLDLPVHDRIEGTAATVSLSIAKGADIVRVHDVKQMVRVARMSDAVVRGWKQI